MNILRGPIPRPTQVDREKILLALKKAVRAQRRLWKVTYELNLSLPIDLDLLYESFGFDSSEGCSDPRDSPEAHLTEFLLNFVEQISDDYWRKEGDFPKYSSLEIDILLSNIHKVIKQRQ